MGNPDKNLALSQFRELRTTERTPVIDLNGVYPLSDLRDDQQTNGGTITDTASEYQVRHSGSGDFARLASSSRGRYQPGMAAEAGIGIRFNNIPSSGEAYWGYFDMEQDSNGNNLETINNALLFGNDSGGFFVEIIAGGESLHKTYKSNWNINSAYPIDLLDGHIFQIEFTYYGFGLIFFELVDSVTGDPEQDTVLLHTFRPSKRTSLDNSNLQVGALVKGDSSEDYSVFVAGRQFSIIGHYDPRTRITSQKSLSNAIDTTYTPLLSFRRKSDRRETAMKLLGFTLATDADALIEIRVKPTLTNASFEAIDDTPSGETALQKDTSATAVDLSTGIRAYEDLIESGSGNNATMMLINNIPADIPDEAIVSFSVRTVSGTGTASIVGRMQEIY